jgi:hypothetical protein
MEEYTKVIGLMARDVEVADLFTSMDLRILAIGWMTCLMGTAFSKKKVMSMQDNG